MNIDYFNSLGEKEARHQLFRCCGTNSWVDLVIARRPFREAEELLRISEEVWDHLPSQAWLEAFAQHPKIGDIDSLRAKFATTANWSRGEQSGVEGASEEVLRRLAKGNEEYQKRFGYIFIVCATGKSAEEMLELLEQRLDNDPEEELRIAAGEQKKIMRLRLQKLLSH